MMGEVIKLKQKLENDRYSVEYVFNGDEIVGVSHPEWNFSIARNGDKVAIVDDDGEPFGVLDGDIFNTILMCWLLIDDPKLIDSAKVGK